MVQGFQYTFSVGNVYTTLDENINIYNGTTNAQIANSTGVSGATINWTATFSGDIKIIVSQGACVHTNTANVTLRLELTAVGNTLDNLNATATDTWIGHVYNWVGTSPPPGGNTSPVTPQNTYPFQDTNYVGYYNVGSETILEGFGGNGACFPVLSNGINRTNILTEVFAVRYRMTSTRPAGCYIISLRGDDGIRLYNDGALVFSEWRQQGPTNYNNVLVYLDGNAELIFDFYEYGGQNVADLKIQPFDTSSNTVATPTNTLVCSNISPGSLDGSSFAYNGGTINPTIAFQWQVSTDNITFTNITGATSENYTPAAITNAGPSNIVRYYRRIIGATSSLGSCNSPSNTITITTTPNGGAPTSNAATLKTCSSFTANWSASANATSYVLDVATTSTFTAGTYISGYQGLNVGTSLSANLTNVYNNPIYYRVRAVYPCGTSSNSPVITVNKATTTWNGSVWSNGNPTIATLAIINGNYNTTTNGDIDACSLTVNAGFTAIISANRYFNIQNNLTVNGTLKVLNNGSLIQIDNSGVNTGNISYERIASVKLQDYVYWSSPISNFDVNSISPLTPAYYHWYWNPTFANPNGGQGYWQNASTVMTAGNGYIVRAPNGFSNTTKQDWTANFNNGIPNNGVYTPTIARGNNTGSGTTVNGVTLKDTDDNWNLLGNPYPSAISINSFLTANTNLDGFVRLWTHGTLPETSNANSFYQNFVSNYTADDYIAINGAGSVSGPTVIPVIGGGQGFFVLMNPGTAASSTVTFNNAMRGKGYSNSQFYRTTNTNPIISEKNRIWLDLTTPSNQASRTLVAYVDDATNLRDRMYDAITDYNSAQNIYTLIDTEVFTIQGRAAFVEEDKVPVGFKTSTQGTHSISIAFVDGLFENDQNIYLEDKELNIIHDLKQNPYSFYALAGINNERFVLRYTDGRLSNDDNQLFEDGLFVVSNENIQITSNNMKIKNVEIYDVLGRRLISKRNVDSNTLLVNEIVKSNNALIVNIVLDNNIKISRKILF